MAENTLRHGGVGAVRAFSTAPAGACAPCNATLIINSQHLPVVRFLLASLENRQFYPNCKKLKFSAAPYLCRLDPNYLGRG